MMDHFSGALFHDERTLSTQEKELLANLLRSAKNHNGNNNLAEMIARAVGETMAQRAYGILGENITQRLMKQLLLDLPKTHYLQPLDPPKHPAPIPPASGPKAVSHQVGTTQAEYPHQADFQPPDPPKPPAPMPPSPGPKLTRAAEVESQDQTENLPANCVVLDELLAPAQLRELIDYTLAHESEFQISEVVSPGVTNGIVDFEHRRSRVLMELGKYGDAIEEKLHAALPNILPRLASRAFPVRQVEMQITASNHGDYFRWHSDNAHDETASRQVTFVYFFHREPKQFQGGELRLYDSQRVHGTYVPMGTYRTIVPQQNQAVIFLSSLAHEITPVQCQSQQFVDSRFTVNGWLHK
jgi:Rps23 Pro-64 3,4-dihydroxylase Tpa1-like proline 4-hydroxylase